MTQFNRIRTVLTAVASVILLAPFASFAQGFPDGDTREISSYALTETALAKFTQATNNLNSLSKAAAGHCDDEGAADSLDAFVARINGVPGAQAAIQSAGMTTREYVVFTWSVFQTGMAAWALDQPGGTLPPSVSRANVDFYRAHEPALNQLSAQQGADPCGNGDDAEDDGEEPEPEEPTE